MENQNQTRISDLVKKEIDDFRTKDVTITKGYKFNQYQTIRRINLYINNRYFERDNDCLFWNISNSRIIKFAKNIDLDTKDLQPIGRGETNFIQSWILKLKFQKWLKDNHFSIKLNDLSEGLATYGSQVFKLWKGESGEKEITECDLRNLIFNPTTKSIRKSNVIELHYLTETEIRDKEGVWNNIEDLIK